MQKIQRTAISTAFLIASIIFVLSLTSTRSLFSSHSPLSQHPEDNLDIPQPDMHHGLIADPDTNVMFVPPRHVLGRSNSPQLSSISVNWNPASCAGDVTPWPADAQAAFAYAIGIWESVIESNIPIEVDACWRPLGSNILGSAGSTSIRRNFNGAPQPNTWYPVALVNDLTGTDVNGGQAEIIANFSSQFTNWYFGTDGNPGPSQYDFVTVVVHEMAHGLGFAGSMNVMSGLGQYGYSGNPTSYDRFTENNGGVKLVNGFPNGSTQLGTQLTTGRVFFNGPDVRSANQGNPAELYSPSSWVLGTSFSHLDDVFDNTNNALMTHSISNGEAIHDPGDITLGLLSDMAWETVDFVPPTPSPTVTPSPSVTPTPTPSGIDDQGTIQIYLPIVLRD